MSGILPFATGIADMGRNLGIFGEKTERAKFSVEGLINKMRPFAEIMGGLVFGTLEELIVGVDRTVSGFMKATGAADEYRDAVHATSEALRQQGLDFTNAGIATEALMQNTSLLRDANMSARVEMQNFVAVMEQAGVSSGITSQAMQVMHKTMGVAGPDTTKEFEGMVHMAQRLGMSISQVSEDFVEAARTLSAHGPRMVGVFRELASQAAATGISTSRLLDIAEQFDTFEGAADAVGRLNGVLGGPYLNSIDMVYKTESERNRAILESVRLSGLSFEAMGRFEKKALAAAVGITDMSEAAAFFNTSLEAFDASEEKALANADAQKKMADMAKQATSIMDNLRNTLMQATVDAAPFIGVLRNLITGFSWFLSNEAGIFAVFSMMTFAIGVKLVSALMAAAIAMGIATATAAPFILGFTAIAGVITLITGGIAIFSASLDDTGKKMDGVISSAERLKGALPTGKLEVRTAETPGTATTFRPVTLRDALIKEDGTVYKIDPQDKPYALGRPGGPVEQAVTSPVPVQTNAKNMGVPTQQTEIFMRALTNIEKTTTEKTTTVAPATERPDTRPVIITVDGGMLTRGVMTYVDGVNKARFMEGLP